jgi:S1-C subfamily serine protease
MTGRRDVDTNQQQPERTEPLFATDWWTAPEAEALPAQAPARRRVAVRATLAAVGVAALLVGSAGYLLARPQPTLTSALPGINSTGSASQAASAGSADPVSTVSAAVVDINTTLGYSGGQAAGTGIVLTADGLVLTNNHVISGATAITATDVGNGRTYTATVVGYDRTHDIAVLRLANASGLRTASIGDSSAVAVGDQVVGVGNAGGVGGTPSSAAGSVTALDRSITAADAGDGTSEQLTGLIQVDAAIQPGDSGGPLVDSQGRVVGVDTAASSGSTLSPSASQGFAIPIRSALAIADEIVAGNASADVHIGETAFLGVQGTAAQGSSGVAVAGVVDGSAAAAAGLAAGDMITAVDDQPVDSPDTLGAVMRAHHPGDKVAITWYDQQGQQHTSTVQLGGGPAA